MKVNGGKNGKRKVLKDGLKNKAEEEGNIGKNHGSKE